MTIDITKARKDAEELINWPTHSWSLHRVKRLVESIPALIDELEKIKYELSRFKEVIANRPGYEKLWAEQVERAESAEAERDELQLQLIQVAAKTLSVRSALKIMRETWRAAAQRSLDFATANPQTPDQWRALGDAECGFAYADTLDPDKDAIFESSDLAKAETERDAALEQVMALETELRIRSWEFD